MTSFDPADYCPFGDIRVHGKVNLACRRPVGPPCKRLIPDRGSTLADLIAAAQAHHEQHHGGTE